MGWAEKGNVFVELAYPEDDLFYVIGEVEKDGAGLNMKLLKISVEKHAKHSFASRDEAVNFIRSEIKEHAVRLQPEDTAKYPHFTPDQFAQIRENQASSKVAHMSKRGRGNRRDGDILTYIGKSVFDAAIFVFVGENVSRVYFAPNWKDYYCIIE